MALILPSPVPRPIAPRCAAAVGSPQRNAHTCRDRSGRTARARAGIGARARRVARRRAARGLCVGHRGRRRDREVALARIGPRSRGPARLPRALGPGHRARAGLPLRRRAPAVRAAGGRGRRGRARPLAERCRGAGRRGPHRRTGADPRCHSPGGRRGGPRLRVAARPLLAGLQPVQRRPAGAGGRRPAVDRPALSPRAGLHRAATGGSAVGARARQPPAGSRRDAGVRRAAHRPRHAGAPPIAPHARRRSPRSSPPGSEPSRTTASPRPAWR